MNKLNILTILLIMFLSCGNSTSKVKNFIKSQKASVSIELHSYKKIIVFQLDTLFSNMNINGNFNGSVIVAKSGTILYKKSFGYCNKETNCLLTDSSMFQLASVSKIITATAVLMLYEREQLDINKNFNYYFNDFPYDGITIKQLLNHRSGLPNYMYFLNNEIAKPNYKMSNAEMYNYILEKNPKAYLKPDTRFNYCNTNYALLALLVEKISGKTFNQFVNEELFNPLGMKHTATIIDINLMAQNITKPYNLKWKPIDLDASDYVLGDKSIYSTPYDLFLFSEALYQNKLIKPETQQLAFTAYSSEKKLSNYGLGWRIKNADDSLTKEVFHNGWWHGYRSSFHRRLKDTLTIVILSNQLNKSAYHTNKIYQILDKSTTGVLEGEEE